MYQEWAAYLPIKEFAEISTALPEIEMKGRGAGPSPFDAKVLLRSLLSMPFSSKGTGRFALLCY